MDHQTPPEIEGNNPMDWKRVVIDPSFSSHSLSSRSMNDVALMRLYFTAMKNVIRNYVPDSRERSIALTHLEDCAMYTNKAISMHGEGNEIQNIAECTDQLLQIPILGFVTYAPDPETEEVPLASPEP